MGKSAAYDLPGIGSAQTSSERLVSFIDRIRRIREEIKERNADIADLYGAAGTEGFDKRVLKVLIKRLDSDPTELENLDNLLALYESQYRSMAAGTSDATRARPRERLDA